MCGCKQQKSSEDKKSKLNISMDIRDKYSVGIINLLIKEFENENKNIEISFTNALGGEADVLEQISKGIQTDIIFTSRNNMIELYKKGFIKELSDVYKENKINERYYNIVNSYGRIKENYYGVGIIPYSIEFLYNKRALNKFGINYPNNISEWGQILKTVEQKNIKVPVLLTEDIDINSGLMSLLLNSKVSVEELGEKYNRSVEEYKNIQGMQSSFDEINKLVSEGYFSDDTFEGGNENSIIRFINGDTPLMVCMSYYSGKFNENEIGIIDDFTLKDSYRANIPVIVNSLMCISINNKNKEEANKFVEFIFSDETQKKLSQLGYITGNKNANIEFASINKIMVQHLYNANDSSIIFVYNLPKGIYKQIPSMINNITQGEYTGHEWMTIIENTSEIY
jgi:ABC-type glycerol-3-phosphate transport system substrate-binding protein